MPHVFRKILNNFPDSKSDDRCEGDGQEMARSQVEDHNCDGWICGCEQHRVRRCSVLTYGDLRYTDRGYCLIFYMLLICMHSFQGI